MIQKNIRFYKKFLFIDLGRPEQPEKKKKRKEKEKKLSLQMNHIKNNK